jgi:hypothetical protein
MSSFTQNPAERRDFGFWLWSGSSIAVEGTNAAEWLFAEYYSCKSKISEGAGGFNPLKPGPNGWAWFRAVEKLIRAVGRGFIPGTKPMQSTSALVAEVCFLHVSPQIPSFSAAS